MKKPIKCQFFNLLTATMSVSLLFANICLAQVTVVNVIPNNMSGETNQDSEPNLAVNPADPNQMAASAFTPSQGFCGPNLAPIFVSNAAGLNWNLNCIVPSDNTGLTRDITVRFSGTTNNLYAGILRRPQPVANQPRLNILRTNNFLNPAVMTVLVDRNGVDQPYIQATTVGANDRVYVGDNDFNPPVLGRTATIDRSINAQLAVPMFNIISIESRATSGQDGPPIRPAIHSDGTIYGIFYGWRAFNFGNATTDVVVVRDDNGGAGGFANLIDPGDGNAGMRVVQNRIVPWANFSQPNFGQERFVGSNISIAVDPNNSDIVYIAWADRMVANGPYTLHISRSLNRGVNWSGDLRTITNATNPALAINDNGTVGFLYQQVIGGLAAPMRWVTHIELTDNAFSNVQDFVLADVPANTPAPQFIPYIGDYVHLMAVGANFHGIFSANNTPNNANFPNGVIYQRNANFATNTLSGLNGNPIHPSIDPFYFLVKQAPVRPIDHKCEYAAKIICGSQRDPENMRLARGFYATAINIHNPNDFNVKFFKKLALTFPPDEQKPGMILPIGTDVLKPDEALEVDCIDIQRKLFPNGFPTPYIKGFVVIQSEAELDVTAVYTTATLDKKGRACKHSGIDVEQICKCREKKQIDLPDLRPLPDSLGHFCNTTKDGKLIVTVKNEGAGAANASVTKVDFFSHGVFTMPTPALAPGATTELLFDIPLGCYDSDCNFKITVDVNVEVSESNETNNVADGTCIG